MLVHWKKTCHKREKQCTEDKKNRLLASMENSEISMRKITGVLNATVHFNLKLEDLISTWKNIKQFW